MNKTYEPQNFEDEIYKFWTSNKFFKSEVDTTRPKFSIVMPPPNVTGQAHIGHALNNTIQDIIIRHKRMQGYNAMWLPGTDHAAIATEAKVVESLEKEGLTKEGIGREEFLKRGWQWYGKYGNIICEQLAKLGISPDWDRLAFTMDENLSNAVKHVFVKYYNDGKIYKGTRVVTWCPHCKSAISEVENIYIDQNTKLWHIKYPAVDGNGFIIVATTRPETLFGDTAIAVNPKDKRYQSLIGRKVFVPLIKREIPVIADDYCELGFGTGAVKITPAHDPNDYEVGLRHNLPIVSCIEDDGKLNDVCGKFSGLDRIDARNAIEKTLSEEGNLVKIENYKNKVGTCERCHSATEPKISTQWFVKMTELAKPAIAVVKEGKLKFTPKRFAKQYLNWLENIQDWCISRQIWLGHRIPAFTCDCNHTFVTEEERPVCPKCGNKNVKQDEDVLDTWFSSALWPFSTLGYPNQTEDLKYYYPTDVLVTGYDIISFWVTKMVFSGMEFMKEVPFKDCVINGLVRDSIGRKMSKSLGNGIDPLDMIAKYGADSLRLSLVVGTSMGNDIKYSEDKAKDAKVLINKLFNAAKFVISSIDGFSHEDVKKLKLEIKDKWILNELNKLVKEVNKNLDKYEQSIAFTKINDFMIGKLCDYYIELSKINIYENKNKNVTQNVLYHVFVNLLKLMHPFIPFVTEEIYQNFPNHGTTIMLEKYPEFDSKLSFKEGDEFYKIIELIKKIRNARAELSVPDNKRTKIFILPIKDENLIKENLSEISKLGFGNEISLIKEEIKETSTKIVCDIANVFLPTSELVDMEKQEQRKLEEIKALQFEITRSEKMLSNQGFTAKAPVALIEQENEKLRKNKEKLASILGA